MNIKKNFVKIFREKMIQNTYTKEEIEEKGQKLKIEQKIKMELIN